VGNWGGEATRWRFDGKKNGKVIAGQTKRPGELLHLEVKVSATALREGACYDMAAVRIRVLDENNNLASYAQLPKNVTVDPETGAETVTYGDANTMSIYLNGVLVRSTVASTVPCTTGPALVYTRLGEGFKGQLDEVRFWSAARTAAQINEAISHVNSWGSMPGKLVEEIIASTKARVDYRKILAGFRATILSEKRKLTRMRPNRRFGFDAMGSRYDFTTRLIIGVDCSGSITKNDLKNFYSTINRFFKYGIKQIDVVQFDVNLGEVQTLLKASENIKVKGRGGTCFQPFIDFVAKHPEYDGALIYTDGYAPKPKIPVGMRSPLCWVLRSEKEVKEHEDWMRESGRVCFIE
jgi:hypothetical protein